jgi:hypothetical protein
LGKEGKEGCWFLVCGPGEGDSIISGFINQQSKDTIRSLQNELINVHATFMSNQKTLKTFLKFTRKNLLILDTLSISEVGEKVTALNEENFQVAAALGEALVHKSREVDRLGCCCCCVPGNKR